MKVPLGAACTPQDFAFAAQIAQAQLKDAVGALLTFGDAAMGAEFDRALRAAKSVERRLQKICSGDEIAARQTIKAHIRSAQRRTKYLPTK